MRGKGLLYLFTALLFMVPSSYVLIIIEAIKHAAVTFDHIMGETHARKRSKMAVIIARQTGSINVSVK